MEPESKDNNMNDNYFYAMMLNAFHTASTQAEFGMYTSYNNTHNYFITDFEKCCNFGDENIFDRLVNNPDNSPNKRFKYNWTPIMRSTWNGNNIFVIHLLNNYKLDLNLKTNDGFTVLHLACMRKHIDYIENFIKKGADIYITDDYGYIPFDYLKDYPVDKEPFYKAYKKELIWKEKKNFLIFITQLIKNRFHHIIFTVEELYKTITSFL